MTLTYVCFTAFFVVMCLCAAFSPKAYSDAERRPLAQLPQKGGAWATKAERAASLAFLLWRDQRGPWELAFFATWAGGVAFDQT